MLKKLLSGSPTDIRRVALEVSCIDLIGSSSPNVTCEYFLYVSGSHCISLRHMEAVMEEYEKQKQQQPQHTWIIPHRLGRGCFVDSKDSQHI